MGISPWGKDSGQERLQCSPQSKLLCPRQGDEHDQHAAGRKTCERHWVLLLKKVCGNEKSPALQASLSEMTERRGFELEFQGLEELSVSFYLIVTPNERLFRFRTSLRLLQTSACVLRCIRLLQPPAFRSSPILGCIAVVGLGVAKWLLTPLYSIPYCWPSQTSASFSSCCGASNSTRIGDCWSRIRHSPVGTENSLGAPSA
jgi:hypothetical protein